MCVAPDIVCLGWCVVFVIVCACARISQRGRGCPLQPSLAQLTLNSVTLQDNDGVGEGGVGKYFAVFALPHPYSPIPCRATSPWEEDDTDCGKAGGE